MTKQKIQEVLKQVNKINLENKKKPDTAKAQTQEVLSDFLDDSGLNKNKLLDKLQVKLDDDPSATYLLAMMEMIELYV